MAILFDVSEVFEFGGEEFGLFGEVGDGFLVHDGVLPEVFVLAGEQLLLQFYLPPHLRILFLQGLTLLFDCL